MAEPGSVTAKTSAMSAVLARGDELLHAVQHPAVALAHRARLEVRGVGARVRLGQAEGAEDLAARQRLQPLLLLLGRAVGQQRRAVGRVVDAHHRRQPAVGRRDLLERQHVGHHVGARAAPFGRHRHAHEAEPAHLGEQRARDLAGGLPGPDMRQHLLAREGAGGVADQGLFFSEQHSRHQGSSRAVVLEIAAVVGRLQRRDGLHHRRHALLDREGRRRAAHVGLHPAGMQRDADHAACGARSLARQLHSMFSAVLLAR